VKWILFVLSLFALFFANNMLFWVPGKYDWLNFTSAGIAILLAAIFAWFSSKKFAKTTPVERPSLCETLKAPPAVIWLFVMSLFAFFGLLKILAYR